MDEDTQLVLVVGGSVVGLLLVIVAAVGVWLCAHKSKHREHMQTLVKARRRSAHLKKANDHHNPTIESLHHPKHGPSVRHAGRGLAASTPMSSHLAKVEEAKALAGEQTPSFPVSPTPIVGRTLNNPLWYDVYY